MEEKNIPALNKKIARQLSDKAEKLAGQGAQSYRITAYQKAAQAVANEPRNLWGVFRATGLKGLAKIPGIGPKIGGEIIGYLNKRSP